VWLGSIVNLVRPYAEALPILEQAAWQERGSFWAHFELARILDRLSTDPLRTSQSLQHNLIATSLNPDSAWAHTNLGKNYVDRALHLQKELDAALPADRPPLERERDECRRLAIDSYRRAIALAPDMATAHSNLANALAKEDPETAEHHFLLALEAEPCNYPALVSYAGFVMRRSSDEELELRWRVTECFPDRADAFSDLAMLYHERANSALEQGDRAKARAELGLAVPAYEQALRLKPDFVYMEQNLGLALLGLGEVDRGLEALDLSLAHRQEDEAPLELHQENHLLLALQQVPSVSTWLRQPSTPSLVWRAEG
jgi:tetratricopeptide (TPR) repeat protein